MNNLPAPHFVRVRRLSGYSTPPPVSLLVSLISQPVSSDERTEFEATNGRRVTQENSEGIAYLKALKRPRPEAAGAATARATITIKDERPGLDAAIEPSEAPSQFRGPEKRRSARYKCAGIANLREVNCNTFHSWARFTDISMLGCYVEAQATYPVGADLQMKLQANGFRIVAKGRVRVNYPHLGMGIAFIELSEENQTALKDLVNSITRPVLIVEPQITLPSFARLENVPEITNPLAAVQALVEVFQNLRMLTREEFLGVLRSSQSSKSRR